MNQKIQLYCLLLSQLISAVCLVYVKALLAKLSQLEPCVMLHFFHHAKIGANLVLMQIFFKLEMFNGFQHLCNLKLFLVVTRNAKQETKNGKLIEIQSNVGSLCRSRLNRIGQSFWSVRQQRRILNWIIW